MAAPKHFLDISDFDAATLTAILSRARVAVRQRDRLELDGAGEVLGAAFSRDGRRLWQRHAPADGFSAVVHGVVDQHAGQCCNCEQKPDQYVPDHVRRPP